MVGASGEVRASLWPLALKVCCRPLLVPQVGKGVVITPSGGQLWTRAPPEMGLLAGLQCAWGVQRH